MARYAPSGTTAATATQAATPAPAPKPATAALPKPTASTAPRSAAPKPAAASTPPRPAAPKPAPAKPAARPSGAPLTAAYAQSYPEGMSAADFSYEDLGQSDATDIAPFEQFPTSRPPPGEGTSFYRERMSAIRESPPIGAGHPRAPADAGRIPVPARYGLPETTVFSGSFGYPQAEQMQSVATFRDYVQQMGGRLIEAERDATEAERALRDAAMKDETTETELKRLYDEKLKRLTAVAGLREGLRVAGVSEGDLPTVMRHAAERE